MNLSRDESHEGSRLARTWLRVGSELGVAVDRSPQVELTDGNVVRGLVLVRRFGAVKGMLVVSDNTAIAGLEEQLISAGYGFSVMSEPRPDEAFQLQWVV